MSDQQKGFQSEELARAKAEHEEFIRLASHDLRAPLRAIANLAKWLKDDLGPGLNGQDSENLELLSRRVARMDRMLQDLASYARAGSDPVQGDLVPVEEALQKAWKLQGPPQNLRLTLANGGELKADAAMLEQVLGALLSNAIKHHDRGAGNILVDAELTEGSLQLTVSDDGPGISPEDREKAFKPFTTLRARDEVEGTGMGLATVKKLVERRGGRAELGSNADGSRGCTVLVSWPAQS